MKIALSRLFLNFFLLSISTLISAQSNTTSGGGEATGTNGSSSFTVGQVFVDTKSDTSGTITEGVQQPFEWLTLEIGDTTIAQNFNIQLFPNPTSGQINLHYKGTLPQNLIADFYDSQGKIISKNKITQNKTIFDISPQAAGIYYIRVRSGNQNVITYKIIKK